MKKAYQLSSLGVPLKHLGVREFSESRWDRLMAWYKSRGVKPRWELVKEVKKPIRRRAKEVSVLDALSERSERLRDEGGEKKESQDVKPNKEE